MKKIAVLGSGKVGEVLANGFLKHGYEVMRGSREPGKLSEWKQAGGAKASVGTFADAAKFGEIVVLAVKGAAAESVVDLAGVANLAGKTVVDTSNPIDESKPPTHGVLHYFTTLEDSLMERLQRRAPAARFVKSFCGRSRPRHRAAVHPVVHPRSHGEDLDPRLQGAEGVGRNEAAPRPAPRGGSSLESFGYQPALPSTGPTQ
jgi:hypothetical protein